VSINGTNYLVPIDADPETLDDVRTQLVSLNTVIEAFTFLGRSSLFILDACRNNPFQESSSERGFAITNGLTEVTLDKSPLDSSTKGMYASGTLIAFATSPGSVAFDGATRTLHSDNWYLRLSEKTMPRSYHLLDYS